ncbi:MAG: hypothetical protein HY040_10395, partial [Planctomycetes bacterium]|nr:hypothetical protein [Planctomycetota bacterium]
MSVTPYNFQKPGPLGIALDHKFAGWLKTLCALLTRKWLKLMPAGVSIQFQMCDSYRAADLLADLGESEVGYPLALQEKLITFMT